MSVGKWWVRLAEELWPRGTWNDQIRKLWTERLWGEAERRPEVVAQCIRNVRCNRSSERVEIAWVLSEISQYTQNQLRADHGKDARIAAAVARAQEDAALRREVADEDAARRTALSHLPEETLLELKGHVGRCLPFLRMAGPVSGWSAMAVGLVHATGIERRSWSTPSPEPSPDPEPSCVTGGSSSTDPPRPLSSSWPADPPHGEPSEGEPQPSEALAEFW